MTRSPRSLKAGYLPEPTAWCRRRCPPSRHPEQFHDATLLLVLGEHGRGPAGRSSSTAASRDSPSDLDGDGRSRNGKQSQSDSRGDRQCDDRTAHGADRCVSEGHPSQEPTGLLTGYAWELSSRAGFGALSCCTFHGQRYRLFRDWGTRSTKCLPASVLRGPRLDSAGEALQAACGALFSSPHIK